MEPGSPIRVAPGVQAFYACALAAGNPRLHRKRHEIVRQDPASGDSVERRLPPRQDGQVLRAGSGATWLGAEGHDHEPGLQLRGEARDRQVLQNNIQALEAVDIAVLENDRPICGTAWRRGVRRAERIDQLPRVGAVQALEGSSPVDGLADLAKHIANVPRRCHADIPEPNGQNMRSHRKPRAVPRGRGALDASDSKVIHR